MFEAFEGSQQAEAKRVMSPTQHCASKKKAVSQKSERKLADYR